MRTRFGVAIGAPRPNAGLVGMIAGFTSGLYWSPGRTTRLVYRNEYPTNVVSHELQLYPRLSVHLRDARELVVAYRPMLVALAYSPPRTADWSSTTPGCRRTLNPLMSTCWCITPTAILPSAEK